MSWVAKPRMNAMPVAGTRGKPGPAAVTATSANSRVSNGLKEFLWLISDSEQGRILDLGPVWQATVTFFIEKGFRVSTEDLLRAREEFRVNTQLQSMRFTTVPAGHPLPRLSLLVFRR